MTRRQKKAYREMKLAFNETFGDIKDVLAGGFCVVALVIWLLVCALLGA